MTLFDLPPSTRVDVSVFPRLFETTTTSYKFFFFLGILKEVQEPAFELSRPILLKTLAQKMLLIALPAFKNRLNFGLADQIPVKLQELQPLVEAWNPVKDQGLPEIVDQVGKMNHLGQLLRFVPYRLLSPFFPAQVRPGDQEWHKFVIRESSPTRGTFYWFTEDGKSIILNQEWAAYFRDHGSLLTEWAYFQLGKYLQKQNPSTPNVMAKLRFDAQRKALTDQKRYWDFALKQASWVCPYSRQSIDPKNYQLDHVLPWSFVGHDALWNLIPVPPQVNNQKRDALPQEADLNRVFDFQIQGLKATQKMRAWESAVEDFVRDFQLSYEALLEPARVLEKYRGLYTPLFQLARTQGFPVGWRV